MLQWLWDNEGPWDDESCKEACAGAAKGGHLDVLQWCKVKGFAWDVSTPTGAANRGHLEVSYSMIEGGGGERKGGGG